MKYLLYSALALLLCIAFINAQKPAYCQAPLAAPSANTNNMNLEMVQILMRHGDRTPLYSTLLSNMDQWDCSLSTYMLPSQSSQQNALSNVNRLFRKVYMPNREYLPGNCSVGQLTSLGFEQHLQLGQTFQSLYIEKYGLLSSQLDPNVMYFRSTDVPRTLQSAQAHITALYPSNSNPGIINLNTMDSYFEDMSPNALLCPEYGILVQNTTTTADYIQFESENAQFKQQLMTTLGVNVFPGWSGVMDLFFATQCHDLPLPQGISQADVDKVYANAIWQWKYQLSFPIVARLGSSPFLNELVNNIKAFLQGQTSVKYFLFSGHDDSVGPLVNLFGLLVDWPPYASHVELELWSDSSNDKYIQFKYNGESYVLDGCSDVMCPVDDFIEIAYSLLVPDYIDACSNSTSLFF
ncbi:hypothetical protein CYY_005821 [Polysphondylium violaceum]|uniref:Counting factor 60 n=1 Tax=Polysphondylium violaceum TaxID=133409 RepID=A0A8J4PRD7_9MYCE|nr:hypothetical protein CYY_005821 [Polysphondylium violaceum]